MSIVAWVVLGALIGLLAQRVLPGRYPYGVAGTVGVGVIGAFLGGAVFSAIASRGVGGFDLVSLLVAFAGAVVLLLLARRLSMGQPRAEGAS